jgi:hypothetical protein
MDHHSATDLWPQLPPSDGGDDKPTISTQDFVAPCNAPVSQDVNGSETIRKKKMRLEKSSKAYHERKQSRTRHATTAKDKY